MKTILKLSLSLLVMFVFISQASAVHNPVFEQQDAISNYLDQNEVSGQDFLSLKLKEVKKATNQKIKLKDRIVFNLTKFKVAKELKNNAELDAATYYKVAAGSFNIGGFLLGFFLPIIGNLIALLFGRNAFRSSLIGTLCAIIAGLIGWAI